MSISGVSLLIFVFLFPGVFFGWGFAQSRPLHSGRTREWLIRYASMSAGWLAVGSWPLHWLYATYWKDLVDGKTLPPSIYIVPVAYLAVPAFAGWWAGRIALKFRGWGRRVEWFGKLLGTGATPSAWDHLFDSREAGFVRCLLRSGRWVGGLYDASQPVPSYASDGKAEQDIYIASAVEFDQESGAVVLRSGKYAWTGGGLYLRSSDIETLDFVPVLPENRNEKDSDDPEPTATV